MTTGESAAAIAVEYANDDTHGYDQEHRNGPDFDCSSLVITIYKLLGFPLKCTYTGNMKADFLANGFEDVIKRVDINTGERMLAGDILLCDSHTAIVVRSGSIVAARINENGTTTGGKTGDQTGKEICVQSYYNFNWTSVLRYTGKKTAAQKISGFPWVYYGTSGAAVAAVQGALLWLGYFKEPCEVDGICGKKTNAAIVDFQKDMGILADGIAGDETLSYLFERR